MQAENGQTRIGTGPGLPGPLGVYIGLVTVVGMAWLAYLVAGVDFSPSTVGEMALFIVLLVAAGSFPLPVAPRVRADVTTAVLFSSALLFEPGVAALAAAVGIVTYTALGRFWGEKLRLPWYKYPFNAGQIALVVGLTAVAFEALSSGDGVLTPAVAAASMYMVNTVLVSVVVRLQVGVNPLTVWWTGTRESGLAEISLLAFGFLGALVYNESAWTVVALFIPVAIIYLAFSRQAKTNRQLEEALKELEALQGRIVSTAKLAPIGALSLDLAHQIKNPLAIMLGRLEGLQEREEEGPARRHLDSAMGAGLRIKELTNTFASIGQQKWVELDVCESLDEAFGMAGLRNRKRIETRREYEERVLKVNGNPVLIRKAFSNIFSNSMEAVEDGGQIEVSATRVNGSVVVRISDDGVGIAQEKMARLFEPFRTTKPNGNGLGLFTTRHIMEMHNGTVAVDSTEGRGTMVTVTMTTGGAAGAHSPEEDDLSARNALTVSGWLAD